MEPKDKKVNKMTVITEKQFKEISKKMNIKLTKSNVIDIYHEDNWDHMVIHWDEETKNECQSYIEFFFDAKDMVEFLTQFLKAMNFQYAYLGNIYNSKYKIKKPSDDISADLYSEFETIFHSQALKINTSKAIGFEKNEIIKWISRFSIGGFIDISDLYLLIPDENIIIKSYHHMNYLFYSNDIKHLKNMIMPVLENKQKILIDA